MKYAVHAGVAFLIVLTFTIFVGTDPLGLLGADDSDPKMPDLFNEVSYQRVGPYGVWVVTDSETGCDYILMSDHVIPRTNAEGAQVCK